MKGNRRQFLIQAAKTLAAFELGPLLFSKAWGANAPITKSNKTLVLIIQRGAMDGLSLVSPIGDTDLKGLRPNLVLPGSGEHAAIRLDGNFGLHPGFSALKSQWDQGTLAFVHQCGPTDVTRSHFDAQDFFESGTPGKKSTSDGFLNRGLSFNPFAGVRSHLRGVALQPSMPRILQGAYPAISMASIKDYAIRGAINHSDIPLGGFEQMYEQAADLIFRGVGEEAFGGLKSVDALKATADLGTPETRGYPKTPIAKRLADISTLIQARVGLEVAVTDMGGWDTHIAQGNEKGQLSERFKELAEALAAFAHDLGPKFSDVCVLSITEFGRTVKENGTRGTDHGHGSVVTVLGGNVRGGRVHGRWKELKPENLFEGRDLPVTTDVREVLADVLRNHLGWSNLSTVLPGFPPAGVTSLGLIKT